jgi:hypothetical protein
LEPVQLLWRKDKSISPAWNPPAVARLLVFVRPQHPDDWIEDYLISPLFFFFASVAVQLTGEWRRLHNKKLLALYSSPDIIRVIKPRRLRWAVHVARMGERRVAYRTLVGKPEGRRPLGRPRRGEDNIKIDL